MKNEVKTLKCLVWHELTDNLVADVEPRYLDVEYSYDEDHVYFQMPNIDFRASDPEYDIRIAFEKEFPNDKIIKL